MLLPLLAFLFASGAVAWAAMKLSSRSTATIERRLDEIAAFGSAEAKSDDADYTRAIADALKRVGNVAPRSASELGKLRQRLVSAGYRSSDALIVFFGIRAACALAAFAVMMSPLLARPNLPMALAACALGYLLPSMALGRMAKKRQHRI